MEETVQAHLEEHIRSIESIIKKTLENLQPLYPTYYSVQGDHPSAAIHPEFIEDIKEITLNSVNQTCKRFVIELKLKKSRDSNTNSYANTLKSNAQKGTNELEDNRNSKFEKSIEKKLDIDKNDTSDTHSVSSMRADIDIPNPLDELKGQRTLINCLHIFGLPEEQLKNEQFQSEIFRRLCKKLRVRVSDKDIDKTYAKKNVLIVKLFKIQDKDKILDCAEDRDIWSNELFELPKGHEPYRIKICHYMTPFYSKMWFTAEKFRNQGRIYSFKLTEKGLSVIYRQASDEKIFLSEQQLVDYIKG